MEHGESLPEPKGVQPRPDLWPAHSHSGIMASSFFWSSLFSLRGERGPCRHSTPGTEAAGATDPAPSLDPLMNLSCPWSCSVALQAPKGAAQPRTLHRSCAGNTAPHGAEAAPGTAGDPRGQAGVRGQGKPWNACLVPTLPSTSEPGLTQNSPPWTRS